MQKSFFTLFFCIFLQSLLFAQYELKQMDYYSKAVYFPLEEALPLEQTAYVFGDKVNIRTEATTKSDVLGQVRIGQVVTIKSVHDQQQMQGINRHWYGITYKNEAGKQEKGFIWGGLLAMGAVDAGRTKLLLGSINTTKSSPEGDAEIMVEVRAIEAGAQIASLSQNIKMAYDGGSLNGLDSTGLEGIKGGLVLITGGGACGISTYFWHVLWDGQHLTSLPILSSVGDGGVFYETFDYIYPAQLPEYMEAKSKIYVRHEFYEAGGAEEDAYDEVSSTSKTIVRPLKWDGKKYVLPNLE